MFASLLPVSAVYLEELVSAAWLYYEHVSTIEILIGLINKFCIDGGRVPVSNTGDDCRSRST
jgi:hypothetical protein